MKSFIFPMDFNNSKLFVCSGRVICPSGMSFPPNENNEKPIRHLCHYMADLVPGCGILM